MGGEQEQGRGSAAGRARLGRCPLDRRPAGGAQHLGAFAFELAARKRNPLIRNDLLCDRHCQPPLKTGTRTVPEKSVEGGRDRLGHRGFQSVDFRGQIGDFRL